MTKSTTLADTTLPAHNTTSDTGQEHMTKAPTTTTTATEKPAKPVKLVPKPPVVLDEQTLPTRRLKSLKPRLRELWAMLEYCRPHGSKTEEAFIAEYIDTLPNMQQDAKGNRYCVVGKDAPTIAWSSHTDTVHHDEGKQAIELDKDGMFALDWHSEASCLGADCTAGVWLMRRLIMAGKPGLYIFHREEEIGGRGSQWLAKHKPELVSGIQAMIALDRKGYGDVITEQTTGRTASDKFALSLARQLGEGWKPDDTGIFTDSAFYSHLIPECTNISVGYFRQHSRWETLDPDFIDQLLVNLIWLKYDELEIARDPAKDDEEDRWSLHYYSNRYARGYASGAWGDDEGMADKEYMDEQFPASSGVKSSYEAWNPNADAELVSLIRRHPEAVAHLLRQWDITEDDIYEAVKDYADELEASCRKAL